MFSITFKDTTLSDISSHSSGFSSTEGHSDNNRNAKHVHSAPDYEHSSEIINSLQTLNTEIRDIWQVLNSQQQMNVAKGNNCTNLYIERIMMDDILQLFRSDSCFTLMSAGNCR